MHELITQRRLAMLCRSCAIVAICYCPQGEAAHGSLGTETMEHLVWVHYDDVLPLLGPLSSGMLHTPARAAHMVQRGLSTALLAQLNRVFLGSME